MSQINFERLKAERPELAEVFGLLEGWLTEHSDVGFMETRRLSRDLYPVAIWDLERAIEMLLEAGVLRERYKVITPAGELLGEEYDDPDEIPQELPTRLMDQWFAVEDDNVVPVFRVLYGRDTP